MYSDHYCTVLNVLNVINTDILGYTFWGTSVEFVGDDNTISAGIIYFLTKDEALNLRIGYKFLR